MSDYINEDASYFEGFDFENAKPMKHPMIAKAQADARAKQEKVLRLFDSDVVALIDEHSNSQKDVERMNTVLRALFA